MADATEIRLDDAIWLALEDDKWKDVAEAGATVLGAAESFTSFKDAVDATMERANAPKDATVKKPAVKATLTPVERNHYTEVGRALAKGGGAVMDAMLKANAFWAGMKGVASAAVRPLQIVGGAAGNTLRKAGSLFGDLASMLLKTAAVFGLVYLTFKGWFDKEFPDMWKRIGDAVSWVVGKVASLAAPLAGMVANLASQGLSALSGWVAESGLGDAISSFLREGGIGKLVSDALLGVLKGAWRFLFGDSAPEETKPVQPPHPDKDKVSRERIRASLEENRHAVSDTSRLEALDNERAALVRRQLEDARRAEAAAGKSEWAKSLEDIRGAREREEEIQRQVNADLRDRSRYNFALQQSERKYNRTVQEVDNLIRRAYADDAALVSDLLKRPLGDKILYLQNFNAAEFAELENRLKANTEAMGIEAAKSLASVKERTREARAELDAATEGTVRRSVEALQRTVPPELAGAEAARFEAFEAADELNALVWDMVNNLSGTGAAMFLGDLASAVEDALATAVTGMADVLKSKAVPLDVVMPRASVTYDDHRRTEYHSESSVSYEQGYQLNRTEGVTNILQVSTIDGSAIEGTLRDIGEKEERIVKELAGQEALLAEVNLFLENVARGNYSENLKVVREAQAAKDGAAGRDGRDGRDGVGRDGRNGRDGLAGADGLAGTDGRDGMDGVGRNGRDGVGRDGRDGTGGNGAQGAAGRDGRDGRDGVSSAPVPGLPGIQGIPGAEGRRGEDGLPGNPLVALVNTGGQKQKTKARMPARAHRASLAIASQTETIIPVG